MIKICVGSQNPVKIACVQEAFERAFPEFSIQCEGLGAPSGVSDQPMTDEETLLGAKNRARYCKEQAKADYFVGIEGGLENVENTLLAFAWIYIIKGEQIGKAKTATFDLPPKIEELIKEGYELGEADDIVFQRENSKQKDGAVGILTKGIIDRKKYYKEAVILALIPFLNTSLY